MSNYIAGFYVVNDLNNSGDSNIQRYLELGEAIAAYAALPNDRVKALGIENTAQPYPGSLDFIQCQNGVDALILDYMNEADWGSHPEILSAANEIRNWVCQENR